MPNLKKIKTALEIDALTKQRMRRNAIVFVCIVAAWVVLDFATKRYFDSGQFELYENIAGPYFGLFRVTLVHNTGAAWGFFADSTFILGVFSIVLCVLLIVFLFVLERRSTLLTCVGISLVVGGGLGNAIDRFTSAYVVDFIDLAFISFPVFNVADIGVTCGIVLFFIGYWKSNKAKMAQDKEAIDEAE